MEFKTTSSTSCARTRAAFTLIQLLVALGLSGVLVTVIGALTLYSGVNFACLANYADLNSTSINAMDQICRDLRQANGATQVSSNSITVLTDTSNTLTYAYWPTNRTLTRTQGATSSVILRECDQLQFLAYQRTPIAGTFAQYEITETNETKIVFVSWSCSRKVLGRKMATDSASAGRVVMRVN